MPKRKAKPAAQPRTPEEMFTPIGAEPAAQDGAGADKQPDLAAQVSDLAKAVDGLVKSGSSREDRLMNMFTQLASRPAASAPAAEPAPAPGIDFSKLPDPTKDPKGYAEAVYNAGLQAGQKAGAAVVKPQMDAQNQQARVEGLWKQFQEAYPDLAEYDDIAQIVAGKIVGDAARLGIDPERTMFMDPDGFMKKVADKMNERIAAIRGSDDEGEEPEGDDGKPARTLGIPGRTQGGADGGNKPAAQPGGSLIDELKEIQTKGRIY